MDPYTEVRGWKPLHAGMLSLLAVVLLWGAVPAQATFPGENGKIAYIYSDAGFQAVAIVDPGVTDLTVLPTMYPQRGTDPTWSPDGEKLAYASHFPGTRCCALTAGEITVSNPDGSDAVNITNNPAKDTAPAWSPDGRRIVFVSDRDSSDPSSSPGSVYGGTDVYVMNTDGSDVRRITSLDSGTLRYPDWSPDGSKIAFVYNFSIWVVNPDGTGLRNLTGNIPPAVPGDPGRDEEYPSWSPDGRFVAFGSNSGIYTVRADGTDLTRIPTPEFFGNAAWSPDGAWIVGETKMMRPDGSGVFQFQGTDVNGHINPDWQPLPFKNASKKCSALPGNYRNRGQCVRASK